MIYHKNKTLQSQGVTSLEKQLKHLRQLKLTDKFPLPVFN